MRIGFRARSAILTTILLITSVVTPTVAHAVADDVATGARDVRPVQTAAAAEDPVPVYRFWSARYQGHFYTASAGERDAIIARWGNVWQYEGPRYTAFETQVEGTVPLYRFWSSRYNGHFYTADEGERDAVIDRWPDIWDYEGVAYYVYPVNSAHPDTTTVARFWSNSARHHFYTANAGERDAVRAKWPHIWAYEGDSFRVPSGGLLEDTPPPAPPAPPVVPGNPGDIKNCDDFSTWAAANAWFMTYYPRYGDVAKLDRDNDGIPCESLLGAP